MKMLITLVVLGSTALAFGYGGYGPQCPAGDQNAPQQPRHVSAPQFRQGDERGYNREQWDERGYNREQGEERGRYNQPEMRRGAPSQGNRNPSDMRTDRSPKGPMDKNVSNPSDQDNDSDADLSLLQNIHEGLSNTGFPLIFLNANEGHITLGGTVESLEKKDQIEDRVKRMEGVKDVENNINVKKNNGMSAAESNLERSERKFPKDTATTKEDRLLNAKIRDKISGGWFSTVNDALILKTDRGIVVISGTVEKPEDVKAFERYISAIEGVKSVKNEMKAKK